MLYPVSGPERSAHPAAPRTEIQALRALAVGVVVLYHLWPERLTGGYVGVDVFFAISGFLITAHLVREVETRGRVRLSQFWARRARRLLPASLLVLAVAAVGTLLVVPQAYWDQFFREIGASALYAQNWVLAFDAVDYLAAENDPSPVQHYWSLSAEEQFYLVWPLLIALALLIVGTTAPLRRRKLAIGLTLGVVVLASLAFSIYQTAANPGWAYFITPTRAWEFGLGGLLAVVAAEPSRLREGIRAVISWLGLAAIAGTAVVYTSATPFPGYLAAIPVLGTLAVIWAGAPRRWFSPTILGDLRPVQWLGDVSYSVYLWHWPLIVLVPFALGRELGALDKGLILVTTLVLAWGTKVLVEDPARNARFLVQGRTWRTYALMVVGMVAIVGLSAGVVSDLQRRAAQEQETAQEQIEEQPECFGAPASEHREDGLCDEVLETGVIVPSAATLPQDRPEIYTDECRTNPDDSTMKECVFGDAESETVVALIGDSHAAQWFPAVQRLAEDQDWALHVFFKGGCAFLDEGDVNLISGSCVTWNESVMERLADWPELDAVVTSATRGYTFRDAGDGAEREETVVSAFARQWQQVVDGGAGLLVLVDTPKMPQSVIDCVQEADSAEVMRSCDVSRERALSGDDYLTPASARVPGAVLLELNDLLCTADRCPAVIGNAIAYWDDSSHMTKTFTRTLAPYLAEPLEQLLAAGAAR